MWSYVLYGALIVFSIWLIMRLLNIVPTMLATIGSEGGRRNYLNNILAAIKTDSATTKRLQFVALSLVAFALGWLAVQRLL